MGPDSARPAERADVFAALADPVRRDLLVRLATGPARVADLAADHPISRPAISRHLRVLLRAEIVADERPAEDARTRIFWLRPETIAPLRDWLDDLQAAGDEQLASFKHHVERRRRA